MKIPVSVSLLAGFLMMCQPLHAEKSTDVHIMTLEQMTKQASSILVVVPQAGQYRVEQIIKGIAPYPVFAVRAPDGEGQKYRYQPATPVQILDKKPVIVFLRFVMPTAMPTALPAKPVGQHFLICENAWESITQQEVIRSYLRQK